MAIDGIEQTIKIAPYCQPTVNVIGDSIKFAKTAVQASINVFKALASGDFKGALTEAFKVVVIVVAERIKMTVTMLILGNV